MAPDNDAPLPPPGDYASSQPFWEMFDSWGSLIVLGWAVWVCYLRLLHGVKDVRPQSPNFAAEGLVAFLHLPPFYLWVSTFIGLGLPWWISLIIGLPLGFISLGVGMYGMGLIDEDS